MPVLFIETKSGKHETLLFDGYFTMIEMNDTHRVYIECGGDFFSPEYGDSFTGIRDRNVVYIFWMLIDRDGIQMINMMTTRCRLMLDNIPLPISVYEEVPVSGRDVVVITSDFRLQCTFDGTPQETIEEIIERNPPLSSL